MTTWGVGEYELMGERLQPAAAELVELAAVTPRDAVLDIACGTGNAALIAARRAERRGVRGRLRRRGAS